MTEEDFSYAVLGGAVVFLAMSVLAILGTLAFLAWRAA
jgi:hypothetical protein